MLHYFASNTLKSSLLSLSLSVCTPKQLCGYDSLLVEKTKKNKTFMLSTEAGFILDDMGSQAVKLKT